MYTAEQIQIFQTSTNQFLRSPIDADTSLEIFMELKDLLRFHEYRYYVLNAPLIADFENDQLFKQLQHFENKHPELITADSPTQRVGNSLNQSFQTVAHLVPMLSLDNSYNAEDLSDFARKARELSGI